MRNFIHISLQNENPGRLRLPGFSILIFMLCYLTGTLSLRRPRLTAALFLFLFVVQPFADVVRDYACQDRQKERCNHCTHVSSPPFSPKESAAKTVYQNRPNSTRFVARRKKKIAFEGTRRGTFPAVGPFAVRSPRTKTRWHKIARLFLSFMLN